MKKKILIVVSIILVLLGLFIFWYYTNEDATTSLNMIEKKWIDNNKKVRQDISIYTDVPVFSYNSEGVVFDYLASLEANTGLEFNKVSYQMNADVKTDYAFMEKSSVGDNDILMYVDNYVLVSTKDNLYLSLDQIKNITVGVLNNTLDRVNDYLYGSDVTFKTFSDYKAMFSSVGKDVDAIVVPKIEYLSEVLSNEDLSLSYNIDEYKTYYVLRLGNNNNLNSILTKYYKKWSETNFTKTFNNYLLNTYFSTSLDSSKNIAKLRSKRYVYGFIENAPYDLVNDGNLIGINNEIIAAFSKVSGVTVEFKQYKNIESMQEAFNKNEIDFFFNLNKDFTYNIDTFNSVSPVGEKIVILAKNSDAIVNSVNSLDSSVGVLKNSKISEYLKKHNKDIKEFDDIKSLMNDKKVEYKAFDNYNYEYYIKKGIKKYHKVYEVNLDSDYTYTFRKISDNNDFIKLFNFYLTFNSTKLLVNKGLINSLEINVFAVAMRYIIVAISIALVFGICMYIYSKIKNNNSKQTLSKGDKLKYIDMLTSLKNRNYLNDNIEKWDSQEVYPQTIIIVDLNNVAYINDNYGHAEGDMVIKEAANILIKTQNPNSEIIRTNGNEFLIYLVSYDEKQIVTYIKKLNKELKDLAHGFGAAIGYSIINDAIKTIDDAINEATIDMKNNKEELSKD